ncbi:MAG: hypothetical protein U0Q03_21135 [Acidimicrobiales bacterium]
MPRQPDRVVDPDGRRQRRPAATLADAHADARAEAGLVAASITKGGGVGDLLA